MSEEMTNAPTPSQKRLERLGIIGDILEVLPTCDLVEVLKNRGGVSVEYIEPHQNASIRVNGPAIVLTVID